MSLFTLDVLTWIIILVVIISIVDVLIKRRFAAKFRNVSSAPYVPIFGSVPGIMLYGIGGGLAKLTAQIKESFLIWVFYKPIYCVTKPEEIQSIMLNQNLLNKGSFYKYIDLMENTLLITDVGCWRNNRKLLNKCFNNQQLNNLSPVYMEFAEMLGNDISEEMSMKDFSQIAEKRFISTFFSSVANYGDKEFDDYIKFDLSAAMKSLTTTMMNRYLNPWYHSDFIFFNCPEGRNFVKLNNLIDGAVTDVIESKKRELGQEGEDGNYYFLDTLIRDYDNMENMKCEVKFFGGAAGLTLSPALSACLVLLGMHQNEQEKVYREIVKVLGKDELLERHHLPHLTYTDMVINEALRLFSPVPLIMRRSVDDIEIGGKAIPKGSDILIAIQNLHRNEDYWEEPLKFKPERFKPEEVEKRPACSFIPFSFGPRNCLGMKYSELVLKFYLVTLIKKFQVFSDCENIEDIKLTDAMFLTLPTDLKLKFLRR